MKNKYIKQKPPYEEYRKIALRFLKEMGLFSAWKEYIIVYLPKSNSSQSKIIYRFNWYKVSHIDVIFGRSNFTYFLRTKYGIKYGTSISDIFRTYVSKIYGNKYSFNVNNTYDGGLIVKVNKETGRIILI